MFLAGVARIQTGAGEGQLEDILEMPVSQEVMKTDAPATRRRLVVRR